MSRQAMVIVLGILGLIAVKCEPSKTASRSVRLVEILNDQYCTLSQQLISTYIVRVLVLRFPLLRYFFLAMMMVDSVV